MWKRDTCEPEQSEWILIWKLEIVESYKAASLCGQRLKSWYEHLWNVQTYSAKSFSLPDPKLASLSKRHNPNSKILIWIVQGNIYRLYITVLVTEWMLEKWCFWCEFNEINAHEHDTSRSVKVHPQRMKKTLSYEKVKIKKGEVQVE